MKRAVCLLLALLPVAAQADDLYRGGNWASLATDRRAEAVGDSLTVLVAENASGSNSIGAGATKRSSLGGSLQAGRISEQPSAGFNSDYSGQGQTSRSGRLVAQLSVVVDRVLPNGDLHVTGMQAMNIGGERTHIKLEGRIRPSDIAADNSILSNRLADAVIEYDGKGYASRGAKPGIVTRVFNFLGIF